MDKHDRYAGRSLAALLAVIVLVVAVGGCSEDPVEPTPPPDVSDVSVSLNPHNALSTVVTFGASNGQTARVVYTDPAGREAATPYYALDGGAGRIVTLGLADTTVYSHWVEVGGAGGSVTSDTVDFETGMLPDSLRAVQLVTTGTSTGGYVLTPVSDLGYVVAFDGGGHIRWYKHIPGMSSRHALQMENGNYAAFMGWTTGSAKDYGEFLEFAPDGEMVGSYRAPMPWYTDGHELLVTVAAGRVTHSHFFSYYHKTMDMSAWGGPVDAQVAGHQILRMRSDGTVEYTWDAWDYLVLEDWVEEPQAGRANAVVDYDHPNSLHIDHDGHYIVSWRHLAEVSKINSQTGEFIWRLGGRNNQFTFVNDPLGAFYGQHSAIILDNGNLLLFDNGLRHDPPQSRAVEYEINTPAMTATMVWEYRHSPSIYTPFVGSVQRFSNGNTLVGFGGAGTATEVDPAGAVVWEGTLYIDSSPTPFYRGRRIRSLYEFQHP